MASRAPHWDRALISSQRAYPGFGTEGDAAIQVAFGYANHTTRRIDVYDDSIMATIQPQTPLNLPEARHQSQLRGFYTAPGGIHLSQRARSPAPTRRRRRAWMEDPAGLDHPGVVGLYGGIENTDELALYDTGVRSIRR